MTWVTTPGFCLKNKKFVDELSLEIIFTISRVSFILSSGRVFPFITSKLRLQKKSLGPKRVNRELCSEAVHGAGSMQGTRRGAGEWVGDPGKHQKLRAKLHSHILLLWPSAWCSLILQTRSSSFSELQGFLVSLLWVSKWINHCVSPTPQ